MWLTQEEIARLFGAARSTVTYHINNIFSSEELDKNTSVEKFDERVNYRPSKFYNLDVILAVGYRIKSQRGIAFRRWANEILKDYLIKGCAIDQKHLEALGKTIDIQKWLTQREMALLFDVDRTRILRHINDIYDDQELEKESTCAESAQVQLEGTRRVTRTIRLYSLDIIVSVGYRSDRNEA